MNKHQFLKSLVLGIIDSFNRSNSTSSLGSTDTGQVWTNGSVYGNAIGINSNMAYSASNVDTAAVLECSSANGNLTMVIGVVANYMGFTFRYANDNNYCAIEIRNVDNKVSVVGKVSGSAFGGASATGYYLSSMPTFANGDTFKITMSGNTITVYRNGSSLGSLTITQNASATKHGIKIAGTSARIDSFRYDQV